MSVGLLLQDTLANGIRLLSNARNGWGKHAPDYVLIDLKGAFPERASPPRPAWQRLLPFGRQSLSIEELSDTLDLIAGTPRVRGIVLRIGSIEAGLARVQNLRATIGRFQGQGKRVVAHLSLLDLPAYLVATAADEIIVPETAMASAFGLSLGGYFLKDALASYGIEVEVEAIAEYKTAMDPFRRSEMSEAHREMLDAIIDSQFEDVVAAIVGARGLSPKRVRALIDETPMTAEAAREAGLVDALLYEDELPTHLAGGNGRARIETLATARGRLRLPYRWRSPGVVGVVSLEGTIMPGASRRFPLPIPLFSTLAGSDTVIQALRRAERDPRVAAVVFHIDSPGGHATASDLIWREVVRLGRKKPVVAYMGDVAGSGGYYVLAGAQHIVAQSASLTGSIGVVSGKPTAKELLGKAQIQHEYLARGRHAMLYHPALAWDDESRRKVRTMAEEVYVLFKRRVSEGRSMAEEEVEQVARGRVWTGKQALERRLVDTLGDFEVAVEKAKELAGLPVDRYVPVVPIAAPKRFTLPQPFQENGDRAAGLFGGTRELLRGGVWALMPWDLRLRW